MDSLTCHFVDVQNFQKNLSTPATVPKKYDSNYDMSEFYHDLASNDPLTQQYLQTTFKHQNIQVNSVTLKEKPLVASDLQDYVCLYEDQCNPDECDCCVFQHCHCRSICPRQCRCYFDSALKQNIIDCSNLNLVEIPNATPIESATDMRLSSNDFQLIKSHSFFGYGQLKYLYLQSNKISYLASDAFDDLRYSLKLLNLANNQLNYLNGDEFQSLSELSIVVLSQNPIKDLDNVQFISAKYLPNLKLVYLSQTKLAPKKLNELVAYSKASTNVTVKYKLVDFQTLINSQTTTTKLAMLTTISPTISQSDKPVLSPIQVVAANNSDTSVASDVVSLLRWYYFPLGVFAGCILLSLTIVVSVIVVAKKYDKNDPTRPKAKKSSMRKSERAATSTATNCFTKLNDDSLSSSSYFAPNVNKAATYVPPTVANEYEVGDYECDDSSENSTRNYNGKCCHTRAPNVFKADLGNKN